MITHFDTSARDDARAVVRELIHDALKSAIEGKRRIEVDGLTTPFSASYLNRASAFIPEAEAALEALDALWNPERER